MTEFYNPYNFIPVTGRIGNEPSAKTPYAAIASGEHPHCRHDLWAKGAHSGRMVCRLVLETPTVVGAKQVEEPGLPSKRVLPYLRDGQPAIPGSSLRGMVGSVMETLSQSALRVLGDGPLKVSVWNGARIEKQPKGTVFDYFRKIDAEVLPWCFAQNPAEKRRKLTPAELLLGVVEDLGADAVKNLDAADNLASRLRFSDGLPVGGKFFGVGDELTLKPLSSPKPPCPAMYFHKPAERDPAKRSYISKRNLSPANAIPNGRKFYLHHPKSSVEEEFWRSRIRKHDDQKLRCTPLRAKSAFFFHVDFDNLTAAELTLLFFSVRPSPVFRHRLGLGKSLGLGQVRLVCEGIFFMDRHQRYGCQALAQPRYCGAWKIQPSENPQELAAAYPEEAACLASDPAGKSYAKFLKDWPHGLSGVALGEESRGIRYRGRWQGLLTLPVQHAAGQFRKLICSTPSEGKGDWSIHADDRTYVWTCALIEDGGNALRARFSPPTLEATHYGHWIKLLNVDGPGETPESTHAARQFERDWAEPLTYHRWEEVGTFYGFTPHSGAMLGPDVKGLPLWKHFGQMYFDQIILLLYVRTTLFRFSEQITRISAKARDAGEAGDEDWRREFENLRRDFALFTNLYQYPLLSNQQQAVEMYGLARQAMDIMELFSEIQSEIHASHDYLVMLDEQRQAEMSTLLTVVATGGLIVGLATGILGMNVLVEDWKASSIGGGWHLVGWVLLVCLVFMLIGLTFSKPVARLFHRLTKFPAWLSQKFSSREPKTR